MYYYARFKAKTNKACFLVGLSGNAKQRRKTLRAFKRSKMYQGFTVSKYVVLNSRGL